MHYRHDNTSIRSLLHKSWSTGWNKRQIIFLFNDALNTFYLRLYGVRHMVKDHSDSEMETRCRHIGYSYRLTARVLLYAPSHRQDNTYHDLCYTSRGALAGTRNRQWVHPMKDRSDDPPHHERTLYLWATLAGTINRSMGTTWRIDPSNHRTMIVRFYNRATSQSPITLLKLHGLGLTTH